jgi:hypothetical protein
LQLIESRFVVDDLIKIIRARVPAEDHRGAG